MITLTIDYYAALRDLAGVNSEQLLTTANTPDEVLKELTEKHSFTLGVDDLKVAVNDEFVNWDHTLSNNDRLVFIPPVSGG